jgi:hypothetical protein
MTSDVIILLFELTNDKAVPLHAMEALGGEKI